MGDPDSDQTWYNRGRMRERTRSQTARARGARGARGAPRGRGSYRPRQYVHQFSFRRTDENGEEQEEPEGPPPPQDFRRRDDGRTPYVHDPTNALGRSRLAGTTSTDKQPRCSDNTPENDTVPPAKVDTTVDDDAPRSAGNEREVVTGTRATSPLKGVVRMKTGAHTTVMSAAHRALPLRGTPIPLSQNDGEPNYPTQCATHESRRCWTP